MHSLNKLGLRFLRKSKALTISSIISIFFTTIVLIFIFNYYQIVQNGYLHKLKENYGDSDLIVTLPNDLDIEEKWIEEIEEINGIEQVAIGQCGETNLNDVSVFTVGVADSEMNKGRYQYHSNMTENRIIINQKMEEEFQLLFAGSSSHCAAKSVRKSNAGEFGAILHAEHCPKRYCSHDCKQTSEQ